MTQEKYRFDLSDGFGKEDILINNIAWALRKLPIFGVFGDGQYRIQPIYVDDLAEIADDIKKLAHEIQDFTIDLIEQKKIKNINLSL